MGESRIMIELGIVLPNLDKEFVLGVLAEIAREFEKKMPKAAAKMEKDIQELVKKELLNSPEYNSIKNGELRGQLGMRDPNAIDVIIDRWVESVNVEYVRATGTLGRIKVEAIRSDYTDVLSLPEATTVYSTRRGGGSLDWLRWLLLEGGQIIVVDYEFVDSRKGRSGLGIMIHQSGGGWSVPPEYAGTRNDNFVTRSFRHINGDIERIAQKRIKEVLKDGS